MRLSICGNQLYSVSRIRQVNHPGGVLLDDLVSLGVAQHSGNHRQVFLNRALLNELRKKDCDREIISLDEFKAWLKDS